MIADLKKSNAQKEKELNAKIVELVDRLQDAVSELKLIEER